MQICKLLIKKSLAHSVGEKFKFLSLSLAKLGPDPKDSVDISAIYFLKFGSYVSYYYDSTLD